MIFVDTNVLSLLFRRNATPENLRPLRYRMQWWIGKQRLAVPGLVVQELLSGIHHKEQFERIHALIQMLPVVQATQEQHVIAAQVANQCMAKGIATHVTDTLLAALALEVNGWVLSEDPDFAHMAPCCGVRVLSVGQAIQLTE